MLPTEKYARDETWYGGAAMEAIHTHPYVVELQIFQFM